MEKINMEKITFVIPSRNNLEFLQLAYKSIRDLKTKHEILVLNDASTDGTQEWMDSLGDNDLIVHNNPGPDRIGIVGMFDKGIEMARTDIIMAFHADMIAAPKLDENILGEANMDGTIFISDQIQPGSSEETQVLLHEMRHATDMKLGKLSYNDDSVYYDGITYPRETRNGKDMIKVDGKWTEAGGDFPWEKTANI